MKRILIFLLFFSITFSTFGQSLIKFERTWTITGVGDYSFNGAFVVNGSNQLLLNYSTNPQMTLVNDSGNLRLLYNGSEKELRATAFLLIDYNTNITQDPATTFIPRNSSILTRSTKNMSEKANQLASTSSLHTIENLTKFVYHYIEYDEAVYGEIIPADLVYENPKGVCVEYSHLLISLARVLGFETNYVNGYAFTNYWQPHAWVEIYIPSYGYLPIDPTFNQAGILDSTHVMVGKGIDQSEIFDSLETSAKLNFTSTDHVEIISQTTNPKGLNIIYSFDENSGLLEIILQNNRGEYVFSNFGISLPEEYSIQENEIILLSPNEKIIRSYNLDISSLQFGYTHSIPFIAHLGDSRISQTLVVSRFNPIPPSQSPDASCFPIFLISALLINLYVSNQ